MAIPHFSLNCVPFPGLFNQLDASVGMVYGVGTDGKVYTLQSEAWEQIPGDLSHVTIGPAGLWGVCQNSSIFKYWNNTWNEVKGELLKQIDAGGPTFVVGVSASDNIFCLPAMATIPSNPVGFTLLDGALVYYSCGPMGCWGVNRYDSIFFRNDITRSSCKGTTWQQIPGSLVMIEVSTDGAVYGVNRQGYLYCR
ncbi:fish-egg lectin-like [Protopterus annectens]|uniref:fish-egg lectin-like n=1 Tax=Protopterus annectens TaxID=7888 RepID=UPI001CFA6885|nr:fish-egg lectin-like [Protopterus annectens]